jgi:hypothetical protein
MAPEEGELPDDGADYTGRVVALDLAFLFNIFLRHGSEFNMRVVKGIPEGANALAAGLKDGSLVVIFDTQVPTEIWFEDLSSHEQISIKDMN